MPLPAPIKILTWMAAPILTGGTSRAGAATLGLAPIRDGTVARALETSAPVTRVSAVIHVMAAGHVPGVIRALAPVRAGIPVPTRDRARASARARMPAPTRVAVLVYARAAFRTPAWILASVRSGLGVPTRGGLGVPIKVLARGPATGAGRIQAPGQAAAEPGQEWIPG